MCKKRGGETRDVFRGQGLRGAVEGMRREETLSARAKAVGGGRPKSEGEGAEEALGKVSLSRFFFFLAIKEKEKTMSQGIETGLEGTVQWLRALATAEKGQSLVPSTMLGNSQLTAYNCSSRGLDTLF